MRYCPHCDRRLVSRYSAKCNWCGHGIENAGYRIAADIDRAVFLQQERERESRALWHFRSSGKSDQNEDIAKSKAVAEFWMDAARSFLEMLANHH